MTAKPATAIAPERRYRRKNNKIKTHFKEVMEISSLLNKTTTNGFHESPKNAKAYLDFKLTEIKQKRLIGTKFDCNVLLNDEKLKECLNETAKEVLEEYDIKRKRDIRIKILTKGSGHLTWNQTRKPSPLKNNY